jgi:hypothetical protein
MSPPPAAANYPIDSALNKIKIKKYKKKTTTKNKKNEKTRSGQI